MLYIIERKKAKENIVKYDPLDLFYLLVYKLSTNNFTVRKWNNLASMACLEIARTTVSSI